MHLISIGNLKSDAVKFPSLLSAIDAWYRIVKAAQWNNLEEVKQSFSSAEAVGNFTVFNIKGDNYRLIVDIQYQAKVIYYKYLLTHAEYDKDKWKDDNYY